MTTKAILYDAGGTLVRPDLKLSDIHALVSATFTNTPSLEAVERALPDPIYFFYIYPQSDAAVTWQVHSDEAFRTSAADYYASAFRRAGLAADEHELKALLRTVYDQAWNPEIWEVFPDVLPTLEEGKRRGCIQGVVSDAASALLGVLDHLGLNQYLDFVIVSALTGLSKPDAAIFQLALDRAGVRPEEALYVGDNYVPDVVGARAAGIPVLLIDRRGEAPPVDVPVIHRLTEIWDYVQK